MANASTKDSVQEYYGQVLKTNDDLKTSACCSTEALPEYLKPIVKEIDDEVVAKFYGCGSPLPPSLKGLNVLDLGSGSGRDSFILSKLVGPEGYVIGVDMTKEQLEVAQNHVDSMTKKWGYLKPNVDFREGFIEDLESLKIESKSIDLVVSNCVINLSPDKERVFSEIFRVLKPGGELYFSDVFSGRRIPEELKKDPVLLGECLSGAMYFEDFRRMLFDLNINDYRIVHNEVLTISDPEVYQKIGMVDFYSATVRAFKMDLEDRCEDYGQVAYYKGTIPSLPHSFTLDDHHEFRTNQPVPVCGNTADMISKSRFGEHFRIEGGKKNHFGLFDCGPSVTQKPQEEMPGACC